MLAPNPTCFTHDAKCAFTGYVDVDFKDNKLDGENDDADSAIVIAYRLVIQDLIQELQDQQEFQETMND